MPHSSVVVVGAILAALSGCVSPLSPIDIGRSAGLTSTILPSGSFELYTMAPSAWDPAAPLNVYIEGDGQAFITRGQVSHDPTPSRPTGLELAVKDPSPNVIYLARPCQFVQGQQRRGCIPAYWTLARYGEDVLTAIDHAIDFYKRQSGTAKIRLFGYSGGGAVALLIAARRDDVEAVVTIAGVLDTDAWTSLDQSTPLIESYNPAAFASQLQTIRQIHWVGDKDEVVPTSVAQSYAHAFSPPQKISVVSGADHRCCWTDLWPQLLKRTQAELSR